MKKTLSVIFVLLILLSIPLLLFALSKRQDIRGKAATNESLIYGTPEITEIAPTQALIKYVTTVKTSTFIAYDIANSSFAGPINNMGRLRYENKNENTAIHSYRLIGLTPSTTYYFIVSGFNPATNAYITPSQILSFTTPNVIKDCTASDLNKDGKTDLKDAGLIQNCLNTKIEGPCANFDLNHDGKIDVLDMTLVTNCFEK